MGQDMHHACVEMRDCLTLLKKIVLKRAVQDVVLEIVTLVVYKSTVHLIVRYAL